MLSGRVQAACWSNCGTNLLFATNTEPIIYGLTIKSDQIFTSNVDTSINHAVPLFDLTKLDLEGTAVGGTVQCMETDPKGNHLAIFFKETNCIAVFNVAKMPVLQLIPRYFFFLIMFFYFAFVIELLRYQQQYRNSL